MELQRHTMRYVATINTPGYLSDGDDEPAVFDTAQEAWDYLADERRREEDDNYELGDDGLSETVSQLHELANDPAATTGTVYADTPGYDGDHDLGLSYSVEVAED